jgi:hypothetical protein
MMTPQVQDFWKPWKSLLSFKQLQNLMITYYKFISDHADQVIEKKVHKKIIPFHCGIAHHIYG